MTQNTQTTAQKVYDIIDSNLGAMCNGDWPVPIANTIAAEIDALTRERDEARAELAGLDAGMRFQFDRAEDYKAQRDEARAEAERLRPAADAWEKLELLRGLQKYYPASLGPEFREALATYEAAAARAAAKESLP